MTNPLDPDNAIRATRAPRVGELDAKALEAAIEAAADYRSGKPYADAIADAIRAYLRTLPVGELVGRDEPTVWLKQYALDVLSGGSSGVYDVKVANFEHDEFAMPLYRRASPLPPPVAEAGLVEAVAAFLKERDEAGLTPDDMGDDERAESARCILEAITALSARPVGEPVAVKPLNKPSHWITTWPGKTDIHVAYADFAEAQHAAKNIENYSTTKTTVTIVPLYAHPAPPVQPQAKRAIAGWSVRGAEAYRLFIGEDEARQYASTWGLVRPVYDGPPQAERADLVEALTKFRDLAPAVMKALMYRGRDELLLADKVHNADHAARTALQKQES